MKSKSIHTVAAVVLSSAMALPVLAADSTETTRSFEQAQSRAKAFKAMTPEERKLKMQAARERMKKFRSEHQAGQMNGQIIGQMQRRMSATQADQ
ncbi:hypothetical protein A9404_02510 [Halothiobacillus diazotrophicus]|uniref:DUF4890 domain-containing protein n=1 Tax=Halothiobacillus diazotrophicus TaxID=1860122 RepID=A0A191ZEU7_9GAMM|nr:hypothetical protein [Halothiobacillus diazotrophicus]ANJ66401.1 hypothetical protein A9404_02510 [Halothiobacillus diazotrophicus]